MAISCVCIIFSILRNLEKLFSTPTKLLNSGFAAATSLLIDYPNSSDSIEEAEHDKLLDFVKCVHTDCNIISPIEPTYSCSVCSRSLHLQCAGLTKPPKENGLVRIARTSIHPLQRICRRPLPAYNMYNKKWVHLNHSIQN